MLYLIVIAVSMLLIAAIVALSAGESFWTTLGFTVLATALVVAIDGLTATIARLLPARFADSQKKIFGVSKQEKLFYEKLKIRSWKEKVPDIGHFTGFRKNKIATPKDLAYIERFLLEICYGQIGHFASVITGFALLLFGFFTPLWTAIAVPVALVSAICNVLPLITLRYNSYKLKILRKNLLRKTARKE